MVDLRLSLGRADLVDLRGKVGKSWLALATDSFAVLARGLRGG